MDKGDFLKKLGNNVRRLRQEKSMKQNELALKCEKDKQSIERLENGKINPSAFYLHQVAEGMDVPLSRFFEINEEL